MAHVNLPPRIVWVGLVDSLQGSLMFSRTWDTAVPLREINAPTAPVQGLTSSRSDGGEEPRLESDRHGNNGRSSTSALSITLESPPNGRNTKAHAGDLRGASLAVALLECSRITWDSAKDEARICTFRWVESFPKPCKLQTNVKFVYRNKGQDRPIVLLTRSLHGVIYIVAGVGNTIELECKFCHGILNTEITVRIKGGLTCFEL